ncbi:MAG UNVERIFIED_CONTAM: TolC family protein [Planctomycetaceae bacterium]|jgi:hypothetical protein
MQNLVRDVVAAYWALVQARTELWAREIQVEQLEFSFRSLEARADVGLRNRPDAAQAKASWSNAKATLVRSRAAVLQREAALRNILGLPPEDGVRLVPSTPPHAIVWSFGGRKSSRPRRPVVRIWLSSTLCWLRISSGWWNERTSPAHHSMLKPCIAGMVSLDASVPPTPVWIHPSMITPTGRWASRSPCL